MERTIHEVEMGDEFRTCPSCGYEDGFHSMFRKIGESVKWCLICPSCHKIYDIGLVANTLTEQQS